VFVGGAAPTAMYLAGLHGCSNTSAMQKLQGIEVCGQERAVCASIKFKEMLMSHSTHTGQDMHIYYMYSS
jgi:hypothetical protein